MWTLPDGSGFMASLGVSRATFFLITEMKMKTKRQKQDE